MGISFLAGAWAVGLALGFIGSPVAHAAPATSWYWAWSDGSRATARTLIEDLDRPWEGLPRLRVASEPAESGRVVELQVRTQGGWRTEDAARTNGSGVAMLALNPYCDSGAWCDVTTNYRLRVAGATARLAVTFTASAASP